MSIGGSLHYKGTATSSAELIYPGGGGAPAEVRIRVAPTEEAGASVWVHIGTNIGGFDPSDGLGYQIFKEDGYVTFAAVNAPVHVATPAGSSVSWTATVMPR